MSEQEQTETSADPAIEMNEPIHVGGVYIVPSEVAAIERHSKNDGHTVATLKSGQVVLIESSLVETAGRLGIM